MSGLFKPDVDKPKPIKERNLTEVQPRGRTGRTIIGGANKQQDVQTQKKVILGG